MKKSILLFSLIVFSFCSFSQLNYIPTNVATSTGTYTDLGSNGSAINTNATGGAMTFNDDNSAIQNIGFNFVFNGQTFTQFVLNTNGFIKLGAIAPATTNIASVLNTTETNCIAVFNMDLDAGTSPEYRVYTSGTTGSRVCTIQFKNTKDYNAILGQYANINFQIKLYETSNNIEFVYGTFTPSISPAIARSATIGIMGNNAMNSVNITKGSSSAWTAATFMEGPYTSSTLFNHRNTTLPTAGVQYKFTAQDLVANDARVYNVYTLGRIPTGYATPQTIQAVVKNAGSTALTNVAVTLNVTGANTFTNTKTIASLAIGEFATVSFDAFTPAIAGANTVAVSVPTDGLNTNNTYTVNQTISTNILSSGYTTTTSNTYVLGSIAAIDFATKFLNVGTKSIDQISCYYPSASTGQPFTVSIYDASGALGTPGATALWTSATQTTTGANVDVLVSPSLSITGDFFVVISQTGTTSIGYAYEVESPLRTNIFFVKQTGGAWTDMSTISSSNCFRLMMDVRFMTGLPTTINNFSAERNENKNGLTWTTNCEINSKGFEVEKSVDGTNFSSIGFVNTIATDNHCTNLNYRFEDEKNIFGNCYYRLKQLDKDGKATISKSVLIKAIKTNNLSITSIYPNPAKSKIDILFEGNKDKTVTYFITDVKGNKVFSGKTLNSNNQNISINLDNLSKGTYILHLSNELETITKSFIKL